MQVRLYPVLLLHSYSYSPTATFLLLQSYCYIPTATFLLLHYYYYSPTPPLCICQLAVLAVLVERLGYVPPVQLTY